SVQGAWSRPLCRDSFLALKTCLGAHPEAVVIDLMGLGDPHAASAATWMTARRVGDAMEPAVQVVAALPPRSVLDDRLGRLGAAYVLPIFGTVAEAHTALARRLAPTDRMRLLLPPEPETPALARNLVTDACAAWGRSDVLHLARLVMSELAGNAVQHARTPIVAVVARRGDGLHLAVCDRDPRLPRLIEAPTDPPGRLWDTPGQGLRTVRAAAAAWGVLPTADGKIVWATVRPR
ncbi:MAG: ATP-binding protein, partial [Actinoplanes sp.]